MPSVRIKRGTRAQIDAAALAGGLFAGEEYLITDENRLAVGLTASTYQDFAKTSESGIGSYTFAGLPSASANSDRVAVVTDVGYGGSLWRSNGTLWRPVGRILLHKITGVTSLPAGAEGVREQIQLPAGVLTAGSWLSAEIAATKSGTSEGLSARLRLGTAGTTADAQIAALASLLTTTNKLVGAQINVRISGDTQAKAWAVGSQTPYGVSAGAPATATIPSVAGTALYLSFTTAFSASAETGTLENLSIYLER